MNFFKAVFADDDPNPPSPDHDPTRTHQPPTSDEHGSEPTSDQPTSSGGGWSLGGLVKTLQVKSDWIESYRRDLEEFGSGLKKETEVLREVATRAVENLSNSLEIGASKAQVSLESMGQAIDSIGLAVADIISQGKESLLLHDHDSSDSVDVGVGSSSGNSNLQSVRYSRFDAQLRAIQSDVNTYIEDPDDVSDYNKWVSEFNLEEKSEEIEGLMRENGTIVGVYKRVVPNAVENDVFWKRYFYRVHRLQQAEDIRAKLVKRAISAGDEEELSWDVDDEDDDEEEDGKKKKVEKEDGENKNADEEHKVAKDNTHVESSASTEQKVDMSEKMEDNEKSNSKAIDNDEASKKLKEKAASEGKTEANEAGKESDVSVVSTQPSTEEDDMGWDEIEDLGSEDEKKPTRSRSPNREELRKRLNVVDDEDDLSWDIEDDD